MGNFLVFGDRRKYVELEAISGSILLLIAIAGVIALFVIYFRCCKTEEDSSTANSDRSTRSNCCKNSRTSLIKNCCTSIKQYCKNCCTSIEYFHKLLGFVFSSVSEVYVKSEDRANPRIVPILVISERKLPPGRTEWFTYFYFTYMFLMCVMWFIAILMELSIYRKTGTCNDINVEVQSFSCFDVDNNYEKIDCDNTTDIETRRVICYLYSPTIAGIGVAFSVAQLISVLGDIAYKLTLNGINQCVWCINILRIVCLLLVVFGFIVFVGVVEDHRISNYFTYGGIPMRWTQLLLLTATLFGIFAFPPWTKYSKLNDSEEDYYTTKYRYLGYKDDVEKGKNSRGA